MKSTFGKKVVTGVVAVASGLMMLGLVAVPAQAQTTEELQAQIAALLAQINALQSQLSGTTSGTTSGLYCDFSFTSDLAAGSTGTEVMQLQKFLNSIDGITVAASGAGSAGNETSYFGPATAQAVSAFQVKYASTILAPLGLTAGTGYWGASSRAQARTLCASAPTTSGEVCGDGLDNDGDGFVDEGCADDEDDDTTLGGGEGSITDFDELSKYSSEEVNEGETETVFGFEFEADGSDISVRRVDVLFEADGSTDANAEPWDFVESVNLYHGSDLVAEMDGDSSSDWSKVTDANADGDSDDDTYRMRFSGLNEVVREDDMSEWSVEVVAKDTLDTGDLNQTFGVSVGTDGIRAVDGSGINIYGGDTSRVTFSFVTATAGTLELSDSEDFDDDVVAKVSDTNDTDDVLVGKFEFEADEQDITIEDLTADLVLSPGTDVDTLVSSLSLYADGDLVESKTVTSSGASTTVTFDDIDFVVEDGETVEFTFMADVQELDGTDDQAEGEILYTAVFGAAINAEDAAGDDVTVSENWNAAGDYTVKLYSKLPVIELVSTSESKNADDGSGNITSGTYTIVFDVTADGGDIFIPNDAIATTSAAAGFSTDGVEILITGTTASTTGTGDAQATLTSTASTSGNNFKVSSGTTKRFTATVAYDNDNNGAGDGFFHAEFQALNWGTTTGAPTSQEFTAGFEDWETASLYLND